MLVGYPTPNKQKARVILEAFCAGVPDALVCDRIPRELLPGAAAFYGVTAETKHLWDQARAEGRDWYYLDNAYFDGCRGEYFRATRNRLQAPGGGDSDGHRLQVLLSMGKVTPPKQWRRNGDHIVLAPQSEPFMRLCAGYAGSWINETLAALRRVTTRQIVARNWTSDKAQWYRDLHRDLKNCWAVVTYSSASAITALVEGVPAIVTAQDCIARPVAFHRAEDIVRRPAGDDRRIGWMQTVADNQWTLMEMREGLCWRMLHAS